MSEFEGLREQAARLLALALKARERGDTKLADQLTEQAAQYLDKTGPLGAPPTSPSSSHQVSQQQQQPQPDDPDTTEEAPSRQAVEPQRDHQRLESCKTLANGISCAKSHTALLRYLYDGACRARSMLQKLEDHIKASLKRGADAERRAAEIADPVLKG